MLIEFKVSNYRSIREEQVFSLVASNTDKELPSCVIAAELPGLSSVKFLKGAAVYGANASGKSNFVEAVRFLRKFVLTSAVRLHPGDPTGAEPFKLDVESIDKPSEFEITFVAQGVRYVYGASVTRERVTEEYLAAYPKGAPQRWFHRLYNSEQGVYEWSKPSAAFKNDKSLQDKTRENSLFLSVGPQFNHEQLTTVFNWFKNELHFISLSAGDVLDSSFTIEMLKEDPVRKEQILKLLKGSDLGIAGIHLEERTVPKDNLDQDQVEQLLSLAQQQLENTIAGQIANVELGEVVQTEVHFKHQSGSSEGVLMGFNSEESAGTRRLFSLVGPWLDILRNGHTAFIDEIETSLHPVLVRELLKLLFCDKNNPKGAQIVFTTHNPVLLDTSLIRRDQVWFTEKTPVGSTHLYPLTDYKPRKNEALAKGYLAGRYGAIPFIPEGLSL